MKKKIVYLVLSISILALAGGCGKKDSKNDSETNQTSDGPTVTEAPDNTASEDTTDTAGAVDEAPVKEDYNVNDYVKLGQYKGIEVTVDKLEVTDEDVEAAIRADLEAHATEEEVTGRAVESGDIANIDYEGLKDGVAFDGGTATGYDLTIGSGTFIPGFEDQIIGMKVGEKRDINLSFPEEYPSEELAGQPVVFKVTLNAIKKTVVPELTEEYVKNNTEYDSIEAYKAAERTRLEEENKETMKNNKVNSVMTTVIDNAEIISYPQTLIDYYTYEVVSYYKSFASQYGMEYADFLAANNMTEESVAQEAKAYAENRAKQELVLNAIVTAEKMELSDQEYKDGLKQIVDEYGYESEEQLIEYITEDVIKETLLWQKAIDFVEAQAVEI
ncbi:trigger factor [Lachnospiraceae bacterium MD1]|jgi:trigger factor|uniref:peptidylprolyl isomerase n=1 Tax=Variimorphobacter saccharofermentans TaxID=2755051 RepID=A0A839JUK5_9FIRM|nr:trigger factor [Variimorphobacter saccharofermentans]MBB2181365.1 trigger factor [Variimorphobacter saccharofermentans]